MKSMYFNNVIVGAVLGIFTLPGIPYASSPLNLIQDSRPEPSGSGASRPLFPSDEEIRQRHFSDVFFLTPQQGWAVGGGGIILATTDGGNNWNKKQIGTGELRKITFQDDRRLW